MLRIKVNRKRSNHGIIRSTIAVKAWLTNPPSVSDVRPAHCIGCGVASRVIAEPLAVHGHGLVSRQIRGPPKVDGRPEVTDVDARRYECQRCGAVMTVLPREVLHGMLYAASAIGLALFLYGVTGQSARAVRERVSIFPALDASTPGWPTLRRWIARVSSLWRLSRPSLPNASTRQQAERAAMELVTHAQIAGEAVLCVFDGAVRAH